MDYDYDGIGYNMNLNKRRNYQLIMNKFLFYKRKNVSVQVFIFAQF